jgi:hypothetical protein
MSGRGGVYGCALSSPFLPPNILEKKLMLPKSDRTVHWSRSMRDPASANAGPTDFQSQTVAAKASDGKIDHRILPSRLSECPQSVGFAAERLATT